MATYTANYGLSKPENTDTTSSFFNDYASNMEIIDQNLGGGGGGGGGHTIVDPSGSAMPSRAKLQFTGNVKVTDDGGNNATIIDSRLIYSETETIVGEFCGKPLYQKCIPFSNITLYANVGYSFNISSYITDYKILFPQWDMSYYYVNNVQRSFTGMTVEPPNVVLVVPVRRDNISGHIVMRYTKTTD